MMPIARVAPAATDLAVPVTPPNTNPINLPVVDSVFGAPDPVQETLVLPVDLVDVTPIDAIPERWFWRTNPIPVRQTRRLAKSITIFPGHRPGGRWSLDDFLVFMNELNDEWEVTERFRRWVTPDGAPGYSFSISANQRADRTIRFHIPCGKQGFGCVTTERDTLGDLWRPCTLTDEGVVAGQCFTLDVKPEHWTSRALILSQIPEMARPIDVSKVLLWFVAYWPYQSDNYPNSNRYYIMALNTAINESGAVSTNGSLRCVRGGELVFILEERREGDPMAAYTVDIKEYSIMSGWFINPDAPGILHNRVQNQIAGFMMDTTWEIMPFYVTAILVAMARNTTISLGFAFGPVESKEVYEQIYTGFAEYGVPLDGAVFESDMHKALIACFSDHNNLHLKCLHHFLKSLKDKNFGVFLAWLVRGRTEDEFNRMSHEFVAPIQAILDLNNHSDAIMDALRKEFGKCGLSFDGTVIAVGTSAEEIATWESVSMWKRVELLMSGTSGALESIHGHLKDDVKRTQDLSSGLMQLQLQSIRSVDSYPVRVRHNYCASLRKAQNIAVKLGPEIARQAQFYGSTADVCPCGQTIHLTKMFSGDVENSFPVPCSHQFHCGAERPRMESCPKLCTDVPEGASKPRLGPAQPRCIIRERRTDQGPVGRGGYLYRLALDNIRRFSKKRKKVVKDWLDTPGTFPTDTGDSFALGIPMSIINLINRGVTEMNKLPTKGKK
jgi:hypothetical protein